MTTKFAFNQITDKVINVMDYGAIGDGVADDTAAIQAACDVVANGVKVYFPKGTYKVTSAGAGPCITLTRNTSLEGETGRGATIRADDVSSTSDIFELSPTSNGGLGDIRDFYIKNLRMFFNGGTGRHCIRKTNDVGVLGMFNAIVDQCVLTAGTATGARSFLAEGGWTFSNIQNCDLSPGVTLDSVADGNVIQNNIFSGTDEGINLNVVFGAYNTTIQNNAITNRDGAIRIVNGQQVKILNNQIEHGAGYGANTATESAHIVIESVDFDAFGISIENNNLGGGTNLDRCIWLDKCDDTIITRNRVADCAVEDYLVGSNCNGTKIFFDNYYTGGTRTDRPPAKPIITDNGVGTMGIENDINTGQANVRFWKDPSTEYVEFDRFSGGVVAVATTVVTMPEGFRPAFQRKYIVSDFAGNAATLECLTTGDIDVTVAPSSNATYGAQLRYISKRGA